MWIVERFIIREELQRESKRKGKDQGFTVQRKVEGRKGNEIARKCKKEI